LGASRALPDLVARVRLDSSGVDSGLQNLVGSFGKANLAMAGAAAGIGLMVVAGKSMIEIAERHEKAENNLAQAVDAYNASAGKSILLDEHAGEARVKAADVSSKANDALTISTNAVKLAQLSYTDAVHKHGAKSEQAYAASLRLQDANIHLAQAQDAAKDAQVALAAATEAANATVIHGAINLEQYKRQVDDFIMSNRRYVSNQSEVVDGFAKLTRAGLTQDEVTKDMNRAVDLAAIKHISLSEAVDLLEKAEHGRMKGLIDLGITTGKYTDAQGNLVNGTKDVSKAMTELDEKLKGGRNTITSLQQHSNELNNDWQQLSLKGGPALVILLDLLAKGGIAFYDAMDRIGKDDHLWASISDRLVKMAAWIKQYVVDPLNAVQNTGWITTPEERQQRMGHRALGGPVIPGGVYTVGENGPETLVMGDRGGTVIPHGQEGSKGETHYHLTLVGTPVVNDPEGVRRTLQRMELMGAAG
jgi:hypothetical protein